MKKDNDPGLLNLYQELLQKYGDPTRVAYRMRMDSIFEETKDRDHEHLIIRSNSSSSSGPSDTQEQVLLATPENIVLLQTAKNMDQDLITVDSDEENEFFDCLDSDDEGQITNQDEMATQERQRRIEEYLQRAREWKPLDLHDDFRIKEGAHKDGGFPLDDAEVLAKYRQAIKDIVKQVGRTIFSGKFNLASVSFPIKCMSHHSILYCIATMNCHSPIYMNIAAQCTDPVERMKHVMVTSLSFVQPCHIFDKPLNPILGETF